VSKSFEKKGMTGQKASATHRAQRTELLRTKEKTGPPEAQKEEGAFPPDLSGRNLQRTKEERVCQVVSGSENFAGKSESRHNSPQEHQPVRLKEQGDRIEVQTMNGGSSWRTRRPNKKKRWVHLRFRGERELTGIEARATKVDGKRSHIFKGLNLTEYDLHRERRRAGTGTVLIRRGDHRCTLG